MGIARHEALVVFAELYCVDDVGGNQQKYRDGTVYLLYNIYVATIASPLPQ